MSDERRNLGSAKPEKIVYIPMCADVVHRGHLNIIKAGSGLGYVVVGLLTDEAIAQKKRLPFMNYSERYEVVSNIKGVDEVIAQSSTDYRPNLLNIRPDFVVHGDDWNEAGTRLSGKKQVIETIKSWGGQLVELEYTAGVSSTAVQEKIRAAGISPETRLAQFARLLAAKKTIRVLEAHNGLSALIVENAQSKSELGNTEQFDAIWVSSLTDSIAKGKPDNELIDRTSRLATINEILDVTTKPIIVDGDTGGHNEHFTHTVRTLERLGVSAVVIEDKVGLKRNSLHPNVNDHYQEEPHRFADKIKAGQSAKLSQYFMIVARIESLILGKGIQDALARAEIYIEAGANMIMIHSKDPTGLDVKEFADNYRRLNNKVPLMLVPTSYNKVSEAELSRWGGNIIVYANHLLRAAYPAMTKAAELILKHQRAYEADAICEPIDKFINIAPGNY